MTSSNEARPKPLSELQNGIHVGFAPIVFPNSLSQRPGGLGVFSLKVSEVVGDRMNRIGVFIERNSPVPVSINGKPLE